MGWAKPFCIFFALALSWVSFAKDSTNHPPRWTQSPVVLPDAYVSDTYVQTLSSFATDPDPNDTLTFTTLSASWAYVTSAGLVLGTPAVGDLGLTSITVRVTDLDGAFAETQVQVKVTQKGDPPRWTVDPLSLGTAVANQSFTFDLIPYVVVPSGRLVHFKKIIASPLWLSVSDTGQVYGTPATVDIESYVSAIAVSDDNIHWVPVNAMGKVVVKKEESREHQTALPPAAREESKEESLDLSRPPAGARVDTIWVLATDSPVYDSFKARLDTYYSALSEAQIKACGVYLSPNAAVHRKPIGGCDEGPLTENADLLWSASAPEYDSPLVALWLFLAGPVQTVSAPYFDKRVPAEILIVSDQGDQYKNYYSWESIKDRVPKNFLAYYYQQFKKADKPFRVSVLAPQGSSAYETLTKGTLGTYYPYTSEDSSVDKAIRDYTQQVVFHASVAAKPTIVLSEAPRDPESIEVRIGERRMSRKYWSYDSSSRAVSVAWHRLSLGSLKPGDSLVVRYEPQPSK